VEQFHSIAQDKGVLKRDEIAAKLQKLKAADAVGQFTFAGLIFTIARGKQHETGLEDPGSVPDSLFLPTELLSQSCSHLSV
jgi:hypothetical protein